MLTYETSAASRSLWILTSSPEKRGTAAIERGTQKTKILDIKVLSLYLPPDGNNNNDNNDNKKVGFRFGRLRQK